MLIPRFSIRWLLVLTTAAAVVSLVFMQAAQGSAWAFAVAAGGTALGLAFALYALFFAIALGSAKLRDAVHPPPARSPFATDAPPPQFLAPRDPE